MKSKNILYLLVIPVFFLFCIGILTGCGQGRNKEVEPQSFQPYKHINKLPAKEQIENAILRLINYGMTEESYQDEKVEYTGYIPKEDFTYVITYKASGSTLKWEGGALLLESLANSVWIVRGLNNSVMHALQVPIVYIEE